MAGPRSPAQLNRSKVTSPVESVRPMQGDAAPVVTWTDAPEIPTFVSVSIT